MLQVFLLLNGLPQDAPGFAGLLQALHQSTRLSLTVINNGQPFSPKRVFHQLGLTCRLLEYPLRFHPAQLLATQLAQRKPRNGPKIAHTLWFEDGTLWHPGHLPVWLTALESWSWIAPRLLPGNTLPQTRQIYQVQALSRPAGEPKLQPLAPEVFPPCFCFGQEAVPLLKEWLSPEGQLPLLMMPACDTAAPAWHPAPASVHHEVVLSIDEALARWQEILASGDVARQQALLESLQRALPDSPAVYARLAPLLAPAEAVALLELALRRRLFYPELLALMVQALIACHQPELAAIYLRHLQQRFAAFEMPATPWPARSGAGLRLHPEALPRQARLTICILVQGSDRDLMSCLDSLKGLEAELIVIDDNNSHRVAEIARSRGAQICPGEGSQDQASARNQALELASGDWMLMLKADETLDASSLPVLRRLLADPPPGLPGFWLPIMEPGTMTHPERRRYALRLFPRHPLLRYEGAICPQLCYQGPGETSAGVLPGLGLGHHPQPQHQQAELERLRAEPLEGCARAEVCCARGAAEAAAGDVETALKAYQRALELNQPDWQAVAAIGRLEALLALNRPQEALTLACAHEKPCQGLPDYWYLRGLAAQRLGQQDEALNAFERCLDQRPGSPGPMVVYPGTTVPDRAGRLPLAALAEGYRARMHHPGQEPRQRQQAAQQLLGILQQLLQSAPAAELLHAHPFILIRLAQAALVATRMQRSGGGIGPSALALYNDYLPPEAATTLAAYYVETALLYLEGRAESLQDRLPADYSFETIRDLQIKPYTLMAFCQELWARSEIDGPELVTALLSLAAQAQQDLSLWLQLSHLYQRAGQPETARAVLADARMQLPANPYLLCQLARLELTLEALESAQRLIGEALALRPDLAEALHLQQELTASRRRKRYSERQSFAKENRA